MSAHRERSVEPIALRPRRRVRRSIAGFSVPTDTRGSLTDPRHDDQKDHARNAEVHQLAHRKISKRETNTTTRSTSASVPMGHLLAHAEIELLIPMLIGPQPADHRPRTVAPQRNGPGRVVLRVQGHVRWQGAPVCPDIVQAFAGANVLQHDEGFEQPRADALVDALYAGQDVGGVSRLWKKSASQPGRGR